MRVGEFLEYLLKHEPTAQLATQLAEVYSTRTRIAQERVAVGATQPA